MGAPRTSAPTRALRTGPQALKLSQNDIDTLARADELERRFDAGIGPRRGGQFAHYRKLERLGLLEFVGLGRDIDGEVESDVLVYKLTAEGRKALDTSRTARTT